MYMDDVYKRIPEEELELLSREIEMCRDAGGDHDYESMLAEDVTARLYTEIEVTFATYRQSNLYHCFVKNQEFGHVERGHSQSNQSFWWALRYALIGLGAAKIEPEQEW
jgi:hypothetical protein